MPKDDIIKELLRCKIVDIKIINGLGLNDEPVGKQLLFESIVTDKVFVQLSNKESIEFLEELLIKIKSK